MPNGQLLLKAHAISSLKCDDVLLQKMSILCAGSVINETTFNVAKIKMTMPVMAYAIEKVVILPSPAIVIDDISPNLKRIGPNCQLDTLLIFPSN
jgi:hypothetical protein